MFQTPTDHEQNMVSPLRSRDEFVELAARVRLGEAAAEEEFVHLFAPRVEAMARGRLRRHEDVDELVDDVLMAVLVALRKDAVREPGSLAAFVHGTALRLIQNRRRMLARNPRTQELDPNLPGSDGVTDIDREDRIRDCRDVLAGLPAIDRQILFLTLVEGLKPGEIAGRVGLSPAAVRQRKSRAMRQIVALVARPRRSDSGEPL